MSWISPDEPIDWHDLLDHIEADMNIDLGNDLLSPQITAIKKAVRQAVREAKA